MPDKIDTYYEPFVGGASILYQLISSNKIVDKYICSDKNNDLISLWNLIKDNPNRVAEQYRCMWNELNYDDDKERKKMYYYSIRERFNEYKDPNDFMFIMRTTTNGMPRYNKSGKFNNSFHITRNGIFPDKLDKIIEEWSCVLNRHNVEFVSQDYSQILSSKHDFLYLDPPYAGTKGMYYGSIDYDSLWNWIRLQNGRYMLSFDGKTSSINSTYNVPRDIYTEHRYLSNGNSSFRRVIGKSNKEYVEESLYLS